MEKEIWKTIIDYPDYQVSNMGRVKSLKNGKERILKQGINKGYCQIILHQNKKQKMYLVHRLVTSAFIPNPQNLPCVNHKNEVKTDNRIENLEYCTAKYNSNYGTRNERVSKAHKGKKHTQETKDKIGKIHKGKKQSQECIAKRIKANSKPIVQIHQSGLIIGVYDSAHQVERELNIFATNITRCCKGKLKTCGGYKFKYLEEIKKAG